MKTRYGWVEIDHIRYDHDVIVHPDRSVTKRSKKKTKKLEEKLRAYAACRSRARISR